MEKCECIQGFIWNTTEQNICISKHDCPSMSHLIRLNIQCFSDNSDNSHRDFSLKKTLRQGLLNSYKLPTKLAFISEV